MKRHDFQWLPLLGTVFLATGLWFFSFYLDWSVFWIKISFSAAVLAGFSFWLQKDQRMRFGFNRKAILIGLLSAAVLYLIFWAGKIISTHLFSFASPQIGEIYAKRGETSPWIIAALLFFITGPCEEVFWRGYLQRRLAIRFGGCGGWLLATAVYAGVHLWSFNFILIGAAAVAGAFWGALYWRLGTLAPVIVSHSIWSAVIFTLLPIP